MIIPEKRSFVAWTNKYLVTRSRFIRLILTSIYRLFKDTGFDLFVMLQYSFV